MRVRVLLGPAGTGKTSQCLEEVRSALASSPDGPPILFLAPKQATYQIERQLLSTDVSGFTRLHILSFERLAAFILDALELPPPRTLDNEGRLMVLRALLARLDSDRRSDAERLQIFRATARLPGFAQELSAVVRECQRGQIGPARLREAAANLSRGSTEKPPLACKLEDIALLFEQYQTWLRDERLEDQDCVLDHAIAALKAASASRSAAAFILFSGVWLDGFAEMTVQETALLAAMLPFCERATLAFCCEPSAVLPAATPTFTPWSVVADTANRCIAAISANRAIQVDVAPLVRVPSADGLAVQRFIGNPELAHLERHWTAPVARPDQPESISVVKCADPEAELTFVAREICRHVSNGGRYRDAAVLVREMCGYHDVVRRVFTRYAIPHFIDQRETVSHHPLAELTRYALRSVAYGWKQEDWLGVLKSGLVPGEQAELDWLENEALAAGWDGDDCRQPLEDSRLQAVRDRALAPVRLFQEAVVTHGSYAPTGPELAQALRELWRQYDVERQLGQWTAEAPDKVVHTTVWEQMQGWLETMALGFAHQHVKLRDWLPIIETGLAGLTVGVIPPVLDEVLVGSIDRSRNPDLKLAFVVGVNEGVFPAPPPTPVLLTETDRLQLVGFMRLSATPRLQLAHERFYGYIAFTRARERLFITFAETDRKGAKRNPSLFISHLQRLFPALQPRSFSGAGEASEPVHVAELAVPLIRAGWAGRRGEPSPAVPLPPSLIERYARLPEPVSPLRAPLAVNLIESLYPSDFTTSVSRIEEFASCPFRFFVTVGLKAKERQRFEVDARQTGSFQHEVLMAFHHHLQDRKIRWRDISPSEAAELIGRIAHQMLPTFNDGVLLATERDRVETENLILALQQFVRAVIAWAPQYEFDPVEVELPFGGKEAQLPPWVLPLEGGRKLIFNGKVDRVDARIDPATGTAHIVVMDYKSSAKEVDAAMLAGGVQIQLFAYLNALVRLPEMAARLGVSRVVPAGAFYLSLRPKIESANDREEAMADIEAAECAAYKHRGRFVSDLLDWFDSSTPAGEAGQQFNFRRNNDGSVSRRNVDPVPAEQFEAILQAVEQQLVTMGNGIFGGDLRVDPYRHKGKEVCERCLYTPICRIDRFTHQFRSLKAPGKQEAEEC